MSTRTRRPFDATWLPFGVLIGTMVGIGLGIEMFGNVWAGGAVGVGLGLVIGVVLGLRGKRGPSAEESEDAILDAAEREHAARHDKEPPQA